MRLPAVSVSKRIARLLDQSPRGSVMAAFPRSCYVDLNGRIVAVVGAELLNGPLNLVVSLPADASLLDVPVGGTVEVRGRAEVRGPAAMEAQGWAMHIAGRWFIDCAPARQWDARLSPLTAAGRLDRPVAAIQTMLDVDAPRESFVRVAGRPQRAAEGMARLATALGTHDFALAGRAADELAGLGPGLTPSGDDVLAGALVAVAILAPPSAHGLRVSIMEATRARTTRISRAYLEAAAAGEAGEAWHRLLAVLGREEVDPADLHAAVDRILAFGETSGADMLAGFVLGMTALDAG